MTSCVNCRGTKFKQTTAELKRHVAGRVFTGKLPARECSSCGMRYYDSPDLGRFDLAVAITLANAGVTEPEALKFMRKASGRRSKEFAELLGVRPETVSRWESGKAGIDRATYAVIQQLLLDRLAGSSTMERSLRVLMHPKKLSKAAPVEDVALASILDRFGEPDGMVWIKGVDPYWVNRLVERRLLLPPSPTRGRSHHQITEEGKTFADRVLHRTAA